MAVGACGKSAGTAAPLPPTRVCSEDAGKRDSILRPEGGLDTFAGTAGRDGGEGNVGVDAAGDGPAADGPDSNRAIDAPPRLDAGDDTGGRGDVVGIDSVGGGGAGGSGAGGAIGAGGSGGTAGSGALGTAGSGGSGAIVDAASDTHDASSTDVTRDVADGASPDQGHGPVDVLAVPDTLPFLDSVPPADTVSDLASAPGALDAPVDAAADVPSVTTCSIASGWVTQIDDSTVSLGADAGPVYGKVSILGGATDQAGNVFIAGTLYGSPATRTVDVGSGVTLTGVGQGGNVLVARLDPATGSFAPGGSASWIQAIGDDNDQVGVGVAASSTNLAMIGNYLGVLGSGTTGIAGLPANPSSLPYDFVVGLDPATGSPAWGKKIDLGGVGMTSIYSNPNLSAYYLCGSSAIATTDLDPNLIAGATDGTTDIVVAKINAADGTVVWARQIGGAGTQACNAVTADGSNVYLTGAYQGTLDFGNGVGAFPVAGTTRRLLWVAKLSDTDGTSLAARTWGTTGTQSVRSITTDVSGNVLIAGQMATTISFGGTVGTLTASGTDAFVAKFDATLTPLWAHNWGDSATQDMRAVATDSGGNVFAVGLFNGSLTAGGLTLTSSGGGDVLTMSLDPAGTVLCMGRYGDLGNDQANWLAVERFATGTQKDRMVFGGEFGGSMTVGNAGAVSSPTVGTLFGYVLATP